YYVSVKFRAIVDGMVVHPDRMLETLDASCGLVFSQPVLLALVEAGLTRDDAYRMVQRAAMRTWDERRPFLPLLEKDAPPPRPPRGATPRVLRPALRPRARRPHGRRPRRARPAAGRALRSAPGWSVVVSRPALPHHYTGKVRDLYEVSDDRMLIVASDRISVF